MVKKDSTPKSSCYQCYKLFYVKDKAAEETAPAKKTGGPVDKTFCSDTCERKYQAAFNK